MGSRARKGVEIPNGPEEIRCRKNNIRISRPIPAAARRFIFYQSTSFLVPTSEAPLQPFQNRKTPSRTRRRRRGQLRVSSRWPWRKCSPGSKVPCDPCYARIGVCGVGPGAGGRWPPGVDRSRGMTHVLVLLRSLGGAPMAEISKLFRPMKRSTWNFKRVEIKIGSYIMA